MISTNAFRTPAIAGALVLALVAAPALADSPAAKTDAKAKESAAWTPPQPGAEHARLKNSVGKWKINQKATFDPATGAVRLETEAPTRRGGTVRYVVEGKVENGSMTGSWNHDATKGDFKITKR